MNHYSAQWIEDWCLANGWTDWFMERSRYWAFPPNAVMPVPIPRQVLRTLKTQYGMCPEERVWAIISILSAVLAGVSSYYLSSPMPLIAAFAFCAITVARMEEDEEF